MPDSVPRKMQGIIGRIMPMIKRMPPQIQQDFIFAHVQKRPNNGTIVGWTKPARHRNPGQARRPRPAQEIHQHRLGLIIGRVRREKGRAPVFARHPGQFPVAEFPRRFFHAQVMPLGIRFDVDTFHAARNIPLARQALDKARIDGRRRAQRMVDMPDDKGVRLSAQEVRQSNRVSAARNRHQQACAAGNVGPQEGCRLLLPGQSYFDWLLEWPGKTLAPGFR